MKCNRCIHYNVCLGYRNIDIDGDSNSCLYVEERPQGDAISRQMAKDRIKAICEKYGLSYEEGERKPATGGSAYALGHAFDDLPPVAPKGEWIPVTYRPMTEEEVKKACEKWGVDEESLDEVDKRIFTCPLPDDRQEILVSHGEYVQEDRCSWDEDLCGLEYFGDWDGVDAWMPKPEPYKKEGEEK